MLSGNQGQQIMTPYQNASSNVSIGAYGQKQSNMRKLLLVVSAVVISLLCIVLVVVIMINKDTSEGDGDGVAQAKTMMMELYEGLDETMSFGELEKKIRETSEEIEIVYDDGIYVIKPNDGEIDDFITCSILVRQDEMEEETSQEYIIDESELNNNQAVLKELLNNIMSEDESKWPDESTESDKEGATVNPYDEVPEVVATDMMSYFTYHYYTEIKDEEDETVLTELIVQPNLAAGGYYLGNGTSTVEYPAKADAMNNLLLMVAK